MGWFSCELGEKTRSWSETTRMKCRMRKLNSARWMVCWTWHEMLRSTGKEKLKWEESYSVIKTNYQFVYLRGYLKSENQMRVLTYTQYIHDRRGLSADEDDAFVVCCLPKAFLLQCSNWQQHAKEAEKGWAMEGCVNELNFISMRGKMSILSYSIS